MTNEIQKPAQTTIKAFFERPDVMNKFKELLGKRSAQFVTSVLQIANSNALLAKADPMSIFNAAATAAILDLPLNNNLGFAYIVPYNVKQDDGSSKVVAQFQMGYKGFIQLSQRSGQFRTISASPIYEGQVLENNPLTGVKFDFGTRKSDIVIGYAAYFELLNGFQKTLYMTVDEIKKHGKRYSQTFKKNFGLWADDFEAMAQKTVIKLLLSKFAPLSIEMQKAVITDQSIINDAETEDVDYVDNEEQPIDKEKERIYLMIQDAKTKADLEKLSKNVPEDLLDLYQFKLDSFNESK